MKITSPKLNTAHLTANDAALLRCETALKLKDKGDYDGAQEVMRPYGRASANALIAKDSILLLLPKSCFALES
jgi:hypothetical protein